MAATKKTSGKASATKKGSAGKTSGAKKASTKTKSSPKRRSAPNSVAAGAPPVEYAREAFSEWRKAARFGAAALLAPRRAGSSKEKPPLKERLNPATTEKGGHVGDALDGLLSKLGFLGKSASKLSLGSRAIEKLRPDVLDKLQPADGGGGNGSLDRVPIQESIEVAVPLAATYSLATRFEDYPEFSERVQGAEEIDDTHVSFDVKLHGSERTVEIEIVEEQRDRRLEWEAVEGVEASGVVTFHELAPTLTHVEFSLDVEPAGLIPRLTRTVHLPDRAVRAELHRFKAYAELWQEVEDVEPPEETEAEPEDEEQEIVEEEEPGPEDEYEEEPEDEYDDNLEDDEYGDEVEDEYEDADGEDEEFEDDEELEEEVERSGAR